MGNDQRHIVCYAMLCSRSQATDIEEQVDVLHGVVVGGDATLLYMRQDRLIPTHALSVRLGGRLMDG